MNPIPQHTRRKPTRRIRNHNRTLLGRLGCYPRWDGFVQSVDLGFVVSDAEGDYEVDLSGVSGGEEGIEGEGLGTYDDFHVCV